MAETTPTKTVDVQTLSFVKPTVTVAELSMALVSLSSSQAFKFKRMDLVEWSLLSIETTKHQIPVSTALYSLSDEEITVSHVALFATYLLTHVAVCSEDYIHLNNMMIRVKNLLSPPFINHVESSDECSVYSSQSETFSEKSDCSPVVMRNPREEELQIRPFDIHKVALPTKLLLTGAPNSGSEDAIFDMVMALKDQFTDRYVISPDAEFRVKFAAWVDEADIYDAMSTNDVVYILDQLLDRCDQVYKATNRYPNIAIVLHNIDASNPNLRKQAVFKQIMHKSYRKTGISVFESSMRPVSPSMSDTYHLLGLVGRVSQRLAADAFKVAFSDAGFLNQHHLSKVLDSTVRGRRGHYLITNAFSTIIPGVYYSTHAVDGGQATNGTVEWLSKLDDITAVPARGFSKDCLDDEADTKRYTVKRPALNESGEYAPSEEEESGAVVRTLDLSKITTPTSVLLIGSPSTHGEEVIYGMVMSLKERFNERHVFCANKDVCREFEAWTDTCNIHEVKSKDEAMDAIKSIMERQEFDARYARKMARVAIVLIDLGSTAKSKPVFTDLYKRSRHMSISVFESSLGRYRIDQDSISSCCLIGTAGLPYASVAYDLAFKDAKFGSFNHFLTTLKEATKGGRGKYLLMDKRLDPPQLYQTKALAKHFEHADEHDGSASSGNEWED